MPPADRYSVVASIFSGPLGTGFSFAPLTPVKGVRDLASVIISREQTQSNRLLVSDFRCCILKCFFANDLDITTSLDVVVTRNIDFCLCSFGNKMPLN